MKYKNLLIFLFSVALLTCTQDDVNETSVAVENEEINKALDGQNFTRSLLSQPLQGNSKTILEQSFNDQFDFNKTRSENDETSRLIYSEDYDFIVDTSLVSEIVSETYHSYTFVIVPQNSSLNVLENYVLTVYNDGRLHQMKITYNILEDYLYDLNGARVEILSGEAINPRSYECEHIFEYDWDPTRGYCLDYKCPSGDHSGESQSGQCKYTAFGNGPYTICQEGGFTIDCSSGEGDDSDSNNGGGSGDDEDPEDNNTDGTNSGGSSGSGGNGSGGVPNNDSDDDDIIVIAPHNIADLGLMATINDKLQEDLNPLEVDSILIGDNEELETIHDFVTDYCPDATCDIEVEDFVHKIVEFYIQTSIFFNTNQSIWFINNLDKLDLLLAVFEIIGNDLTEQEIDSFIHIINENLDENPVFFADCRSFEYAQPPGALQKGCAVINFNNTFITGGFRNGGPYYGEVDSYIPIVYFTMPNGLTNGQASNLTAQAVTGAVYATDLYFINNPDESEHAIGDYFKDSLRAAMRSIGGSVSTSVEPFPIPSPAPYLLTIPGLGNPIDCD